MAQRHKPMNGSDSRSPASVRVQSQPTLERNRWPLLEERDRKAVPEHGPLVMAGCLLAMFVA